MLRFLYRFLLCLHPGLSVSVSPRGCSGSSTKQRSKARVGCLPDGFTSLMRQWLLRSGVWKLLAAIAGGGVWTRLTAALATRVGLHPVRLATCLFAYWPLLATLLAISLTLTLCVLWFRFSRRRRA